MKPTVQISRQNRHIDSSRPASQHVIKSPATDWSFQSTADLRGGAASATRRAKQSAPIRGLYAMTQTAFDAATKWEDRVEAIGVSIVISISAWSILTAIATSIDIVR
jgi:hypothetical protein